MTEKNGQPSDRSKHLAEYKWKPGQSGNPSGRRKDVPSLAHALRRVGVHSAEMRADLVAAAEQMGLDPAKTHRVDILASLIFDCATQLLIRTMKGDDVPGDKLVGILQLILKAIDGDQPGATINTQINVDARGVLDMLGKLKATTGFVDEEKLA